jgi:hypothetical protein
VSANAAMTKFCRNSPQAAATAYPSALVTKDRPPWQSHCSIAPINQPQVFAGTRDRPKRTPREVQYVRQFSVRAARLDLGDHRASQCRASPPSWFQAQKRCGGISATLVQFIPVQNKVNAIGGSVAKVFRRPRTIPTMADPEDPPAQSPPSPRFRRRLQSVILPLSSRVMSLPQ